MLSIKRATVALVAALLLSTPVSACGGNTSDGSSASSATTSAEAPQKKPLNTTPVCELLPIADVQPLLGQAIIRTDSKPLLEDEPLPGEYLCRYYVAEDDEFKVLEIYRIKESETATQWQDQHAESHITVGDGWDTIIREGGNVVMVRPDNGLITFVSYLGPNVSQDALVKIAELAATRMAS
ncbi:MAG: hypothetical protein HZB75_03300 [Candidatus Saccharibacteria bacterium]|nr:MAG: hypothetical protein HZB75_03300 [Candidatus Saccharibacteria bacterium]